MTGTQPKRILSKLSNAKSAARTALHRIHLELTRDAERDLRRLAKRHPGCKVLFISAMGTWYASWQGKDGRWVDVQTPCCRSFESVQKEFGWAAIPTIELNMVHDPSATTTVTTS